MNKSYTKYKIQFKADNETIAKALGTAIKGDYDRRRDAYEIKRCIRTLFPEVTVEILAISRTTRIRKLAG